VARYGPVPAVETGAQLRSPWCRRCPSPRGVLPRRRRETAVPKGRRRAVLRVSGIDPLAEYLVYAEGGQDQAALEGECSPRGAWGRPEFAGRASAGHLGRGSRARSTRVGRSCDNDGRVLALEAASQELIRKYAELPRTLLLLGGWENKGKKRKRQSLEDYWLLPNY
jgi:hypothetical protein